MERSRPASPTSVLHRQVIGPHEMEHEYGLVGGNIFHGELTPGQMFHARPAPGYADLRTPITGLYQAGSATHGGGGVTGIPGRNVVRQVLADRGPPAGATAHPGPPPRDRPAGSVAAAPLRRGGGIPARARPGAGSPTLDLPGPARRAGPRDEGHRRARGRTPCRRRPARRVRARDHHPRRRAGGRTPTCAGTVARQAVPRRPPALPAPEPCAVGALRCPYHSWTYDLDGRLIKAPHTDDVEDFDPHPRFSPCTRWGADSWGGFLWVHGSPGRSADPCSTSSARCRSGSSATRCPDWSWDGR